MRNKCTEIDCYEKILDFFQENKFKKKKIELWKNKTFIALMKKLEKTQNRVLVKNAIILMISLFDNIPPDIYNNRGIDIDLLSKADKSNLYTKLKEEFA
ncbi:MAG: hypothetical protein P8Y70_07545 [Candidatus Lokiarchaeota archaeon]